MVRVILISSREIGEITKNLPPDWKDKSIDNTNLWNFIFEINKDNLGLFYLLANIKADNPVHENFKAIEYKSESQAYCPIETYRKFLDYKSFQFSKNIDKEQLRRAFGEELLNLNNNDHPVAPDYFGKILYKEVTGKSEDKKIPKKTLFFLFHEFPWRLGSLDNLRAKYVDAVINDISGLIQEEIEQWVLISHDWDWQTTSSKDHVEVDKDSNVVFEKLSETTKEKLKNSMIFLFQHEPKTNHIYRDILLKLKKHIEKLSSLSESELRLYIRTDIKCENKTEKVDNDSIQYKLITFKKNES
jgi:hypothetical protein